MGTAPVPPVRPDGTPLSASDMLSIALQISSGARSRAELAAAYGISERQVQAIEQEFLGRAAAIFFPPRHKSALFWLVLTLLPLLLILSFGLRVQQLGQQSFWLDEAISATVAFNGPEYVIAHSRADVHPPLYGLLLSGWSLIDAREFSLRYLSVLFGILTLALLYQLALQLFRSRITGLATVTLAGLSGFLIYYSQEARMYSLVVFFETAILLCSWMVLSSEKKTIYAVGYVLASAGGLYTHYQAGLLLLVLNLIALIYALTYARDRLLLWLALQVLVGLIYLPWASVFFNQLMLGGRYWVPFQPSLRIFILPWMSFISTEGLSLLDDHLIAIGFMIAATVAFLWSRAGQSQRWGAYVVLIAGLWLLHCIAYGVSASSNIYAARYLMGGAILSLLLLGRIAGWALESPGWPARLLGGVAAITFLVLTLRGTVAVYDPRFARENWRGALAFVDRYSDADSLVGFTFTEPMAPYQYYARVYGYDVPATGLIYDGELLPEGLALAEHADQVWLFLYLNDLFDPEGRVLPALIDMGYEPVLEHEFGVVRVLELRQAPSK